MPPKKRSLPGVHNSNFESNKRPHDSPLPDSGKRRKHADVNNKELRRDSYCWECHQFGYDIECKKDNCQRVYHNVCLEKKIQFVDGVCPECQQQKSKNKFLTVDNLRDILEVAVKEFRKKFQSPDRVIFFQWPNIETNELVRIIDLDLLEDNIKDTQNPYRSLAGFISDVKWIHHNYCVLDGVDSSTAKEAEGFVRAIQKEIFDIEDCPMCYYNMLVSHNGRKGNFFLKICDPPHDIVWAKLKGSPHWPAKCLRVVNGKAHVRFFSTHDKSNIPLDKKKCFAISLHHPEHKSSKITDVNLVPKKIEYKEAVEELLDYIKLYERKFGRKFKFHAVGTPYKYEAPKLIHKKRRMNHHSVPVAHYSDEILPMPFSEEDLNNTNEIVPIDITLSSEGSSVPFPEIDANQSTDHDKESANVLSEQTRNHSGSIEEGIHTSEDNTNRTEFAAMDSSLFERANVKKASTSPVLSASMICEVANSCEGQTSDIHQLPSQIEFSQLNLPPDTSIVTTSNFQPLITCTSTPVVTAVSQWSSLSRAQNLLSGSAGSFQELHGFGGSQHLDSDTESLGSESIQSIQLDPSPSGIISNEDDEVVFLSSNRCSRNLNPSNVLQHIFADNPDLQNLFRDGRFVFDSLFLRLWAFASRCSQAPEIISSLITDMRNLNNQRINLLKEKIALEKKNRDEEKKVHQEECIRLQEINNRLKERLEELTNELQKEKERNDTIMNNARVLIDRLHRQYQKTLETGEREILVEKDEMLNEKDVKIGVMNDTISKLKEEIGELKGKHAEAVESYSLKLEHLLKTQKERISQETKQEIKDTIAQHLNEIKLSLKPETSSRVIENQERNQPSFSGDGNGKRSTRRSPPKSERNYHRQPLDAGTYGATINHQHFHQQQEISTVARKTSIGVRLERTVKTTSTTRNEGKILGYNPPTYGHPFDPSPSAPPTYGHPFDPSPSAGCMFPITPPIVPLGTGHPPFNLSHLPHHMRSPHLFPSPHPREREGFNPEPRKR